MLLRKCKYGLFIVFVVALLLTFHLSLIGLPDFLARDIEKHLQFSGLAITLEKVKLGVFEGVIATHVRCYRKGDIGIPLLEAEKIVLILQPFAWLGGGNGLSGAIVKNGVLNMPVRRGASGAASGAEERFKVQVVHGRVLWDQGATRLRVKEFAARMPGMKLTGRGEVVLPQQPANATNIVSQQPAFDGAQGVSLNRLLADWSRCGVGTNGGGAVNFDTTFFLDVNDMDALDIQVQADARHTRFSKTELGAWRLKLNVKGKNGEGVLDLIDADIEGINVATGSARFAFNERALTLRSLNAVVGKDRWRGPLNLTGEYDWKTRQYKGAATTAFNPYALLPLLYDMKLPQAPVIEWFQFQDQPPVGKGDFNGGVGTNLFFHLTGQAQGDNCRYGGVSNLFMKLSFVLDLSATNESLTMDPILVVREEGTVQGRARQNFLRQSVSFDGVSTADPHAVAGMIAPCVANIVGLFRFEGPSRVAACGIAGYNGGAKNDIDIDIDAQRSGWKRVLMDRCSMNIRVVEDSFYINDVLADICKGSLSGTGAVSPVLNSTNMRYQIQGDIHDVDINLLVRDMVAPIPDHRRGFLSGQLELEGFLGEADGRSAVGRGWIEIGNGQIFQIPLFGGLSEFLGRIVPGLGSLMRETEARATFVVKDGKFHSDDIVVAGDVVSLTGKGDYYWNGNLDYTAQVKLLKTDTLLGELLQFAMAPVTKMLEFRLTGTVSNPHWYPAFLPKEMFLIFD